MKLSPAWLREFVDARVDDRRLAQDLTAVGIAVESISGEGKSTVFEMEIGTNRPDAMNHYGVAREASVIYNLPLRALDSKLPAAPGNSDFAIEIADQTGCARYTARVVRDVKIKPSPDAMAKRLLLVDQRPINNAADATNYTLWEMGHPTHVFDLDLLEGGKILVRRAFSGETLKTLDGVERKLTPEDLVIADAVKPVALAGVMGGFDTMITAKTKNILIESAWFDPSTVRKTSRRHGLHTDASHRFERGADFESTILSTNRVADLILQSGGGELVGDVVDVIARRIDQAPVALHLEEVYRILGPHVTVEQILRILRALGFGLTAERTDATEFTVDIPSWRLDIEREIDLIEEIARVYGYDKFPNALPAYVGSVVELPDAGKDAKLRSTLLALGYNEAVSLTFIAKQEAARYSAAPPIELENPLSEEASVMRTSLLPGMVNMLVYNLNRGVDNVRLFEAGNVYEYEGLQSAETKRISIGATGYALLPAPTQPGRLYSFLDMKGDVESLLEAFQHESLCFDASTASYLHPGRSARAVLDGTVVADFGQIHPDLAAQRKLRQDAFVGEIYLDRLYQQDLRVVRYQPLPRYPAVQRDFSFVFDDSVAFEKVADAVQGLQLAALRSFTPVEVFRGGGIRQGKYSILLRAVFQSSERTLREDEVAQWASRMVEALTQLGGSLRAQ
jgi:phenylalanyl-tRNA synthetase beta chain